MINEIIYLYPSAVPLVDFVLGDKSDGNGPFIARWDETKFGPKPTQAEIDREISVAAKITLAKRRADIFPDVLNFLATLPGAPLSIKNAAVLATAEMAKVKP